MAQISNKDIIGIFNTVKGKIKVLPRKQKLMLGALVAITLISAYLNMFYKPNMEKIGSLKKSIASYRDKSDMLKAQMPPMAIAKKDLADIVKDIDEASAKIKKIEAELPPLNQLPQILSELITRAGKYNLEFVSIVPTYTKGTKDIYSSLEIQMEFFTTYNDLANFIKYLKDNPSFLYTREVSLEESEQNTEKLLASVKLASLIIDEQKLGSKISLPELNLGDIKLTRDPFSSEVKPLSTDQEKKKAVLMGVVLRGEHSTAIINNEVYRIGDMMEGKKIEQINRNSVILKNNRGTYIITLEDKATGEQK